MYDEDFGSVPRQIKGMTKREMEEDLRRALLNSGGTLVPREEPAAEPVLPPVRPVQVLKPVGKVVRDHRGRHLRCPTADEIARIVIAASREFDIDPIKVVVGAGPYDARRQRNEEALRSAIKRARAYAALALLELFPETPKAWISSYVGVVSTKTYLWNCEHARQIGKYQWWSEDAFKRVLGSLGGEDAGTDSQ